MQQRKPLTIYDLEALTNAAEYIISTAQFNFIDYDDDGNYISYGAPQEERAARRKKWIAGMKTHYLCFRENEELHSIGFQDALEMPLFEIKEKYLKKHMTKLRNMLRKDSVDLNMAPVSDDVPDSYLEDLLAMTWKETLKLWAIQWDKGWNKMKVSEGNDEHEIR